MLSSMYPQQASLDGIFGDITDSSLNRSISSADATLINEAFSHDDSTTCATKISPTVSAPMLRATGQNAFLQDEAATTLMPTEEIAVRKQFSATCPLSVSAATLSQLTLGPCNAASTQICHLTSKETAFTSTKQDLSLFAGEDSRINIGDSREEKPYVSSPCQAAEVFSGAFGHPIGDRISDGVTKFKDIPQVIGPATTMCVGEISPVPSDSCSTTTQLVNECHPSLILTLASTLSSDDELDSTLPTQGTISIAPLSPSSTRRRPSKSSLRPAHIHYHRPKSPVLSERGEPHKSHINASFHRHSCSPTSSSVCTTSRSISSKRVRGLWNPRCACLFYQFHDDLLIDSIFSFLAMEDVLRATMVCRRWRHCGSHPHVWKSVDASGFVARLFDANLASCVPSCEGFESAAYKDQDEVLTLRSSDSLDDSTSHSAIVKTSSRLMSILSLRKRHIQFLTIRHVDHRLSADVAILGIGSLLATGRLTELTLVGYACLTDTLVNLMLLSHRLDTPTKKSYAFNFSLGWGDNIANERIGLRHKRHASSPIVGKEVAMTPKARASKRIYQNTFDADHGSQLTVLRLEQCPLLTDRTIQFIVANCSQLRELSLRGCRGITNDGILTGLASLVRSETASYSDSGQYGTHFVSSTGNSKSDAFSQSVPLRNGVPQPFRTTPGARPEHLSTIASTLQSMFELAPSTAALADGARGNIDSPNLQLPFAPSFEEPARYTRPNMTSSRLQSMFAPPPAPTDSGIVGSVFSNFRRMSAPPLTSKSKSSTFVTSTASQNLVSLFASPPHLLDDSERLEHAPASSTIAPGLTPVFSEPPSASPLLSLPISQSLPNSTLASVELPPPIQTSLARASSLTSITKAGNPRQHDSMSNKSAPSLTALDLSHTSVTADGIVDFFDLMCLSNGGRAAALSSLLINGTGEGWTDELLLRLENFLEPSNLISLDIGCANVFAGSTKLSDAALCSFLLRTRMEHTKGFNTTKLRVLRLAGHLSLTAQALADIISSSPMLEELNLGGCRGLILNETMMSLKSSQSFDIGTMVTASLCIHDTSSGKKPELLPPSIDALVCSLKNNSVNSPRLKKLNLWRCFRSKKEAIDNAQAFCQEIRYGSAILEALCSGPSAATILELDLDSCYFVYPDLVNFVKNKCIRLSKLSLRGTHHNEHVVSRAP